MTLPSPSDLPHEARQVLLQLELVSAGPAQSFDKEGGRSAERSARPAGPSDRDDAVPHLFWRRRMLEEPHRLAEHITGAQETLEKLLRSPEPVDVVPESPADRDARCLKLGEGFSVDQVLWHFRDLTRRQVVALRARNGRSIETGYLLREVKDDPEDRLERALGMRRQNKSYRQIELETGCSRMMVWRAENKRAA